MVSPPSPSGSKVGSYISGMASRVLGAFGRAEKVNGYNEVPAGDEEMGDKFVFQDIEGEDLEGVSLINTPSQVRGQNDRSCGYGVLCKVGGILAMSIFLYGAFKLVIWALAPAPTILEKQPSYSDSLGCLSASHSYNGTESIKVSIPIAEDGAHKFDIRGGSVGTFVISQGLSNAKEVQYDIALRSDDEEALRKVSIIQAGDGHSSLLIDTPRLLAGNPSCMRFDVVVYVPRNLEVLWVASHVAAHIRFDPSSTLDTLERLQVTSFSMNQKSMILPHAHLRPKRVILQAFGGWIVGDISIVETTSINTQNGAAQAYVRLHAAHGLEAANLQTTTGAGRSDFFYVNEARRQIDSTHISSQNGPVYLTYKQAGFSGKIAMKSKAYSAEGVVELLPAEHSAENDQPQWTHWHRDKDGKDSIIINSRGWTGLYF